MKQKRQNVGVVTSPIASAAGNTPLSNLVDILRPLSDNVYIITGNEGALLSRRCEERIHLRKICHKSGVNMFSRGTNYVYTQLRISYQLARLARSVDVWILLFGEALVLPMLSAKLLGGKVVLAFTMNVAQIAQAQKDPLGKVLAFSKIINCALSNRIIVYSERIVEEQGLQKHRSKISIGHEHFLDFGMFTISKFLRERDDLVGYIGRLSEEKGILNLIEAIPKVLSERDTVKLLIGGDGQLRGKVEEFTHTKNLGNKVRFVGWVPHDELPHCLNQLKLLVLPSYTEGLPNIVLESMACGTPVLATPVGGVPDVIRDRETGFIMEDNSPECIARNVVRALNHPDLEQITINARALVKKEYTYEAAVEGYRNILTSLRPK